MQRIFLGLAVVALLLLGANLLLGLSGGDYNAAAHAYYDSGDKLKALEQDRNADLDTIKAARTEHEKLLEAAKALQPAMTRHMLLGIAAALVTLLVCSVSITYFVGTSKWCKEVCDTYHLDQNYVRQNDQTKRKSFRWALAGAGAIVLVVGLGAAAEPTWMNAKSSQSLVQPHYLAALVAIGFIAVSFYMQSSALAENGRIIEQVMSDVRRIRAERGMAHEEARV